MPANPVKQTLPIIYISLIMGISMFAGFALFVRRDDPWGQAELLGYLGLAFAFVTIVLHLIVPSFVSATSIKQLDREAFLALSADQQDEQLSVIFQTSKIVAGALLEGGAFFNLIAFLTEGGSINLLMAGVLLLNLILGFPTPNRIDHWLEDQKNLMQMRRS
ncbi:MAG: hypothetical protein KDA87_05770 [Planctomycetales bacterium]|nr:hypothetical protein [Planctomycetales bacterium]